MDENSKYNPKVDSSYQSAEDSQERPIVWLRDDNDRKYRELSWKLRKGESQYLLFEGAGSVFEKKINPNASQFTISKPEDDKSVDRQPQPIPTFTKQPVQPKPTVDINISNDVPAKNAGGQMNMDTNSTYQQPLNDIINPNNSLNQIMDDRFDPKEDVDAFAKALNDQGPIKFEESHQRIEDNLNQTAGQEWQPDTQSITDDNQEAIVQPFDQNQSFAPKATPVDLKRRGQIEALNKKLQDFLKNQQEK